MIPIEISKWLECMGTLTEISDSLCGAFLTCLSEYSLHELTTRCCLVSRCPKYQQRSIYALCDRRPEKHNAPIAVVCLQEMTFTCASRTVESVVHLCPRLVNAKVN